MLFRSIREELYPHGVPPRTIVVGALGPPIDINNVRERERERESATTHLGEPFCDTAWPGQARNGEGHRLAALGLNC